MLRFKSLVAGRRACRSASCHGGTDAGSLDDGAICVEVHSGSQPRRRESSGVWLYRFACHTVVRRETGADISGASRDVMGGA